MHQIHEDMQTYNVDHVLLHAIFPHSYPFEPPFIRVVVPYIERGKILSNMSSFPLCNLAKLHLVCMCW